MNGMRAVRGWLHGTAHWTALGALPSEHGETDCQVDAWSSGPNLPPFSSHSPFLSIRIPFCGLLPLLSDWYNILEDGLRGRKRGSHEDGEEGGCMMTGRE